MSPEEVHVMKYELLHDLGDAVRSTRAGVTQPSVTAPTAAPHGGLRAGEMLHPDDVAIEGRW